MYRYQIWKCTMLRLTKFLFNVLMKTVDFYILIFVFTSSGWIYLRTVAFGLLTQTFIFSVFTLRSFLCGLCARSNIGMSSCSNCCLYFFHRYFDWSQSLSSVFNVFLFSFILSWKIIINPMNLQTSSKWKDSNMQYICNLVSNIYLTLCIWPSTISGKKKIK